MVLNIHILQSMGMGRLGNFISTTINSRTSRLGKQDQVFPSAYFQLQVGGLYAATYDLPLTLIFRTTTSL